MYKRQPVNGLRMYYEVHGSGEPLVLMHGGLGSTEMMGALIPALGRTRQVVAVDLQAHGRTADVDRPLRYETMADDIAGLIAHIGAGKADVMGYSLGGGVAVRTAIQHPGLVRRLVVASIPFRRQGWFPEVLAAMAQMGPDSAEAMKQSPLYRIYSSVAPRPGDWVLLHEKVRSLITREYDWSAEIAAMQAPTMLAVGDADAILPEHTVEFFKLLGGGKRDAGWDGSGMSSARLAVLPGLTHYDICSTPALALAVLPFLDGA